MKLGLGVLALAVMLGGCISSAPIVPETPANQAQIASCDATASLHNGVVIGDFVVGGATTGLAAGAAAVTDGNTRTALAVAGAIAGGVTTIGAALAAYTASNFANSQCPSVVGSLPVAARKQ